MGLTIYHNLTKYLFVVILVLLPITQVYGGWTGSVEVVLGAWGNNVGQFGFEPGDTADIYPNQFGVDKDGNILVADLVNRRVQIFKTDGSVYGTINKPSEIDVTMWPRSLVIFSGGNSFLGNLYVFNYAGDIVYKVNIAKTERYDFNGGYIIKNLDNNTYFLYSPTGQFIKTSTTRPLELGSVQSIGIGSGKYKTTVKYPDITYDFVDDQPVEKYYRDKNDNFHRVEIFTERVGGDDVTAYRVHKYSRCSKKIAVLNIPLSSYEPMPAEAADLPTWKPAPIMEYGEPLVAPNGDVYAWARTKTKYKILKWTWVDDPNVPTGPDAPSGLAVTPSINGLYLTWTASPNDPGCLTGYEVARATSAGGLFFTVGTVEKGTVKYNDTSATAGTTYYYKVRAMAGSDPSAYTAEVAGKR